MLVGVGRGAGGVSDCRISMFPMVAWWLGGCPFPNFPHTPSYPPPCRSNVVWVLRLCMHVTDIVAYAMYECNIV